MLFLDLLFRSCLKSGMPKEWEHGYFLRFFLTFPAILIDGVIVAEPSSQLAGQTLPLWVLTNFNALTFRSISPALLPIWSAVMSAERRIWPSSMMKAALWATPPSSS